MYTTIVLGFEVTVCASQSLNNAFKKIMGTCDGQCKSMTNPAVLRQVGWVGWSIMFAVGILSDKAILPMMFRFYDMKGDIEYLLAWYCSRYTELFTAENYLIILILHFIFLFCANQ